MPERQPDLPMSTRTWPPTCSRRRRRWARIRGLRRGSCRERLTASARSWSRAARADPNGWRGESAAIERKFQLRLRDGMLNDKTRSSAARLRMGTENAMTGKVVAAAKSVYQYPLLIKHLWHAPLLQAADQEIVYRDLKRFR